MKGTTAKDKAILKKYGIKPCSIVLDNLTFSKIRIKCSAESSEKTDKFSCAVNRVSNNVFSIKIKRKFVDISIDDANENPRKLRKINNSVKIQNMKKGVCYMCECEM